MATYECTVTYSADNEYTVTAGSSEVAAKEALRRWFTGADGKTVFNEAQRITVSWKDQDGVYWNADFGIKWIEDTLKERAFYA